MANSTGYLFWGFLIVYGIIMMILSPKHVTTDGFFQGKSNEGSEPRQTVLMLSIFISWIFAKSVTNAANLGAEYGFVGGLSYAIYWLCIPITGLALYRLRRRYSAQGMVHFLTKEYGRVASVAFSAAILIRLFNEIWSNTSVVGGYYGDAGSKAFVLSALLFTGITLVYSVIGGLRSSIITDSIQAIIFIFFVGFVTVAILPKHGIGDFIHAGTWRMDTGLDMVLVSLIQIFSYGFHDPVLTDRGFITDEKVMLRAFVVSGLLGFFAILIFSFIGIHARLIGLELTNNMPATLGRTLGVAGYFAMIVVMISAAGSTLDSTFASLGKLSAKDLPEIAGKGMPKNARAIAVVIMIAFAIFGNLPMIVGTDILKATTISGTMVVGLAPIFLLHGIVKPTKTGFHLSFWIGIVLGVLLAAEAVPAAWAIGDGKNAMTLGVNLYGTILCTLGYVIPGFFKKGCGDCGTHN
ncbi:MAG: hypothetical protein SOW18_04315 [Peptoniphilus sp.]|nr:hypothetical protein [Peptoniphilus sp.]MDY3118745.1 hypothetical protein [Peptoniphilus sp.]